MAENEYKFDPDLLQYDEEGVSTKRKLFRVVLTQLFAGIVIGFIFFVTFSYVAESENERKLKRENKQLEEQYERLRDKYEQTNTVLQDVQKRDDNIYRAIFETDPTLMKDSNKLDSEKNKHLDLSELVANNALRLKSIQNEVEKQERLVFNIDSIFEVKSKVLENIPSIQPLQNHDFELIFYGFGQRIDPFYKTPAFHEGIDFAIKEGTPVYATANGTVSQANEKRLHGKQIMLSHGNGYETRYAHLSKILVRQGAKVKRGDVIGLTGNTGKSVTEHLHYEVILNNKPLNPINFFFGDLTPAQYFYMIKVSSLGGLSLD